MALSLTRLAAQRAAVRCLSTTAALKDASTLTPAGREKYYPKIGNREIVGFGFNGHPVYIDRADYPMPAIRFKETTPEVAALQEKEKGDWSALTLDEKKALYRVSYCQTFQELNNFNKGEWKSILAIIFFCFSMTGWMLIYMKAFVYPEMPHTITREWQKDQLEYMVRQGAQPIEGISSQWDYEKGQWK